MFANFIAAVADTVTDSAADTVATGTEIVTEGTTTLLGKAGDFISDHAIPLAAATAVTAVAAGGYWYYRNRKGGKATTATVEPTSADPTNGDPITEEIAEVLKKQQSTVKETTMLEFLFDTIYNGSEDIPFDPAWPNGTGYFNSAVKLDLPAGANRRSVCPETGRRILLKGSEHGTLVAFERYTKGYSDNFVVCVNVPEHWESMDDQLTGSIDTLTLAKYWSLKESK